MESVQETTVYLDADYRCHSASKKGRTAFKTSLFAGREELIPYYRLVPEGETWVRRDGTVFEGEMWAPIDPHEEP